MDWRKLLTRQRIGKDTPDEPLKARTCFQQDYDRLVFSSPFRRLKDKTQVFSLVKNDYVRTRLIHSIEVSCVGRSLGTVVGYEIKQRHNLDEFSASDFGDIVSAACLAHDIGNPPFGHSGEDTIRAGFQSWYKTAEVPLTVEEKTDFELFEGNAQGFRILTRLEMQRYGGMRLTYPTLAAFTKYPKASFIPADTLNGYTGKSVAKYGFFQSEKELFAEVADRVGLIRRADSWWARHPLAFLVEAADDICYHMVDLEDGYRMGYIPYAEAEAVLNEVAQLPNLNHYSASDDEKIKLLRATAIDNLVVEASQIFLDYEQDLLAGNFDRELVTLSTRIEGLKAIKDMTRNKIYIDPDVISIRIAGYEVLGNLFEDFVNATLKRSDRGDLFREMLPIQYRPSENESCYGKILRVTDYISGMTDSYATSLFQKLKGISLR